MATLTKGKTFGSTEQVTAAKLSALVDDGTCTEIVNADVNVSAAIAGSKLDLTSSTGAITATTLIIDDINLVMWESELVCWESDAITTS